MDQADLLSKLRRLLSSRGRTAVDADDLIQEAFLRLHTYRRQKEVRQPEAFLVRTVLNLSIDELRSSRARTTMTGALETLKLVDPKPGPDEVLAGQERLRLLKAGLAALGARTRQVILMHRIEGASYRQIASKLGISVSAVEKHIAKAALHLTEWMDES